MFLKWRCLSATKICKKSKDTRCDWCELCLVSCMLCSQYLQTVLSILVKFCSMIDLTWVTRNLVSRSGSRLFSLDRIISSISPWSFSMTTNTRSGVSNMHSRFTMPGWCRFWRTQTEQKSVTVGRELFLNVENLNINGSQSKCTSNNIEHKKNLFLPVKWLLRSVAGSPAWWGNASCLWP